MPEPRKVERIRNRMDETEFRDIDRTPTIVRTLRRTRPKIVGIAGVEGPKRKLVRSRKSY